MPYGFHNFIYGWIDTAEDNWPPLLPKQIVPVGFELYSHINPTEADIMFTQGLNKRLGVEGKSIPEIAALAAEKNMSVDDVMALKETDGWEYTGLEPRDGEAYVCSAYVTALYKAAGLFDGVDIQATEFTPKDVYQLDFFDTEYKRPAECVHADPDLPYCQIMGKYQMTLPGYGTVSIYDHMNENCPINFPTYERDEGC